MALIGAPGGEEKEIRVEKMWWINGYIYMYVCIYNLFPYILQTKNFRFKISGKHKKVNMNKTTLRHVTIKLLKREIKRKYWKWPKMTTTWHVGEQWFPFLWTSHLKPWRSGDSGGIFKVLKEKPINMEFCIQ